METKIIEDAVESKFTDQYLMSRRGHNDLLKQDIVRLAQSIADQSKREGYELALEEVEKEIKKYFKGLVVITDPQKTKENILIKIAHLKETI